MITNTASIKPLHADLMVLVIVVSILLLSGCGSSSSGDAEAVVANNTTALSDLGQRLYFDTNLSNPVGQSCASCHLPTAGFADPDNIFPTSEGAIAGRFGNRNTPTASYAAHTPPFQFDAGRDQFVGGQFLDGRASSLELQAQAPFLNPLEMNMSDKEAVVAQVRLAAYAEEFETVFGIDSLADTNTAYEQVSQAIAAFERTALFSPFSSKFDAVQNGTDIFTVSEANGRNLFNGKADCNRCHRTRNGAPQVFSNFEYRNIGVPENPANPFLTLDPALNPDGTAFVDLGLGGVLADAAENGKFRTPTLRNIGVTAPYMHNGVFDTLAEVIDFYNRRDLDGVVPEVNQNVDNGGNIGNLTLTPAEVSDLIAFLETLTDT
jgi:cytochrome c peroxidase